MVLEAELFHKPIDLWYWGGGILRISDIRSLRDWLENNAVHCEWTFHYDLAGNHMELRWDVDGLSVHLLSGNQTIPFSVDKDGWVHT